MNMQTLNVQVINPNKPEKVKEDKDRSFWEID